jgi:hypothetical protein
VYGSALQRHSHGITAPTAALPYKPLHSTLLCCTVLYYPLYHCLLLYSTVLQSVILHYTLLYFTIQHFHVIQVEPSWAMQDKFLVYEQQPAMALDCLKSTHPVSTRVDNPSQISEVFDSISYSKGKFWHNCQEVGFCPGCSKSGKLQNRSQTLRRNFTGFFALMGPMLTVMVRWVCISLNWDINVPTDKLLRTGCRWNYSWKWETKLLRKNASHCHFRPPPLW